MAGGDQIRPQLSQWSPKSGSGNNKYGPVRTANGGDHHLGNNYINNQYNVNNDPAYAFGILFENPRFSGPISNSRAYNALRERARPVPLRGEFYMSSRKPLKLASLPKQQLAARIKEEKERLLMTGSIVDASFDDTAYNNVKRIWIEQGIWNNKWSKTNASSWRWKHEEPPEYKWWWIQKRRTAECQRQASRPISQFFYQLSKERERMEREERGLGGWKGTLSVDVNTKAAVNIKERWENWGIWNHEWGLYPGMTWAHEDSPEEEKGPSNDAQFSITPQQLRASVASLVCVVLFIGFRTYASPTKSQILAEKGFCHYEADEL